MLAYKSNRVHWLWSLSKVEQKIGGSFELKQSPIFQMFIIIGWKIEIIVRNKLCYERCFKVAKDKTDYVFIIYSYFV